MAHPNLIGMDSASPSISSRDPNTILYCTAQSVDWFQILFPANNIEGILYTIVLICMTIWVIIGNSLVCIGTYTAYTYGQVCPIYLCYVSGLDVFVGIFMLPLLSLIKIAGKFPFGDAACNVFVFWDYFIILTSAFGHFGLIIFFLWEIKSPETLNRDPTFHMKILSSLWICVLIVWVPAYTADLATEPEHADGAPFGTALTKTCICGFSNHNNEYGSIYLAVFGFIIPYFVGISLSIWAFIILWQQKLKEKVKNLHLIAAIKHEAHELLKNGFHLHHNNPINQQQATVQVGINSKSHGKAAAGGVATRKQKKAKVARKGSKIKNDSQINRLNGLKPAIKQIIAPGPIRPFCIEAILYPANVAAVLGKNASENSTTKHAEYHKMPPHEIALVYAMFAAYSILRTPYYTYFTIGIFMPEIFPQDLSVGIYWIMDINSVISCMIHLSLEPSVRAGVKQWWHNLWTSTKKCCCICCTRAKNSNSSPVIYFNNFTTLP